VGDREEPPAKVRGIAKARIGAKRGDERLLEAVVGIDRSDARDEKPVNVLAVGVEERLERW
jgi:hypothetical protein